MLVYFDIYTTNYMHNPTLTFYLELNNMGNTLNPTKERRLLESIEDEHSRWTEILKNTRQNCWPEQYLISEMDVTMQRWRHMQQERGVHQQSKQESASIESLRKDNLKMSNEIRRLQSIINSFHARPAQGRDRNAPAVSPSFDKREIETLNGRILDLKAKIASLEDDKQQLMLRLSKIAGDRLMDNNPNIADLSDQNRPTKLAERYNELYDNEWTDAYEALVDAGHGEDDAIETLRLTLMNVFSFCERKSEMMIHNAATVVDVMFEEYRSLTTTGHYNEPPSHLTIRRKGPRCVSMYPNHVKGDGLPFELQDILLQKRWQPKVTGSNSPSLEKTRSVSKQDDIAKLKEIGEKKLITLRKEIALSMLPLVQQAYIDASWSSDCIPLMKPYIRQCLYVCWMMVVQTPPMAFHATTEAGETFDKRYYREYMATGPSIKYVVWPPMLLHKEGSLVAKGVAQGAHTITDVDGFANID